MKHLTINQPGDRGSSPRESISCPHCKTPFARSGDTVVLTANRPIGEGDFTICLNCREIIRFNSQLQLHALTQEDWLELIEEKELFVAMMHFRLHLLTTQIKRGTHEFDHSADGLSRVGEVNSCEGI